MDLNRHFKFVPCSIPHAPYLMSIHRLLLEFSNEISMATCSIVRYIGTYIVHTSASSKRAHFHFVWLNSFIFKLSVRITRQDQNHRALNVYTTIAIAVAIAASVAAVTTTMWNGINTVQSTFECVMHLLRLPYHVFIFDENIFHYCSLFPFSKKILHVCNVSLDTCISVHEQFWLLYNLNNPIYGGNSTRIIYKCKSIKWHKDKHQASLSSFKLSQRRTQNTHYTEYRVYKVQIASVWRINWIES